MNVEKNKKINNFHIKTYFVKYVYFVKDICKQVVKKLVVFIK